MEFTDFYWLNEDSQHILLKGGYVLNQTIQERIQTICRTAEEYLREMGVPKAEGFADRLYGYVAKGWISFASPVWSNFGTARGLPISCNGSAYGDSVESILMKQAEIGMMTKYGAGTSLYIGALRPRGADISTGGKSEGPVSFLDVIETQTQTISQGTVRRGACAAYFDIEHPDIEEFLKIRDEGNSIQRMTFGVCIGDAWMEAMLAEMEDIKAGSLRASDAKKVGIWAKIVKKRFASGMPYLFFRDNANNGAPEYYKGRIKASNLCSEIMQPSDEHTSFACCLSSPNVLHYYDWKDTDFIFDITMFLDTVMEEYIRKTADIPLLHDAYTFARDNRTIGVGILGWQSFLQRYSIPFESLDAAMINVDIAEYMDKETLRASQYMATYAGEPDGLKGTGVRNGVRMAIAPTVTSSMILGAVSPSIEPWHANIFVQNLSKIMVTVKNPFLAEVLDTYGKNTAEVWDSIMQHGGSVAHLEFLSDHERDVFKTFGEISQLAVIEQAAARQKYIDQGQSLNIMVPHNTPAKQVSNLMIEAWKQGVKSLYYQRGSNAVQDTNRNIATCTTCEA